MGYTFAAALVKKTGTAPQTRKAIREGMENLGYQKASSAEDAALALPLHHDKKSAWMTIALEMPENVGRQMELLRKLAAEMHTAILYFMNFDSDYLYVGATDGKAIQHVHVGYIDEDEGDEPDGLMQSSDDLSVFDALLPDEAARAEFRRILAVDMMERVFSESAAHEMAALFGYTPEVLFVDEDAEPFALLAFDAVGGGEAPLFVPENSPPAFCDGILGMENPVSMTIVPCGGVGRGMRILMQAEGYDAQEWEAPCIRISNTINKRLGSPAPEEFEAYIVPKRAVFPDGSKGWAAEIPDVPLFRGVNPGHPNRHSEKASKCVRAGSYWVLIAFYEGRFRTMEPDEPLQAALPEGDWRERKRANYVTLLEKYGQKTHIWVVPMENPEGWMHHALPLQQPQKRLLWLKGYVPEEIR